MLGPDLKPAEPKLRDGSVPPARRLVLLDINMPRMNGLEFLRALRGDPDLHSTPVVMLTTSDEERDRFEAYALNVAGYLLKPSSFQRFRDLVDTLYGYWSRCEVP